MAQSGKGAGGKSGASGKNTGGKGASAANAKNTNISRPIRREVCAVCLLFLGIFSVLGYFNIDAWFIRIFCGLVKGLIGWGFYIFPPMLLVSACIAGLHKGRPITLRIVSAMVTPLLLGSILHMLLCKTDFEFESGLVSLLYNAGMEMQCGGLIGGLLSMALESMFSVYGAIPVLIISLMFFLMLAFNQTPSKIIEAFRNRVKPEYEYIPEPEAEQTPAKPARQPRQLAKKPPRAIDIPLDEPAPPEPEYVEEKVGFFNTKPRVLPPDRVVEEIPEEPVSIDAIEINGFSQPEPEPEPVHIAAAVAVTEKIKPAEVVAETAQIAKTIETVMTEQKSEYIMPNISLLKKGGKSTVDSREEIALNRERLESTTKSFGVSAAITNVTRGPTVTRYDLELEAGVKLNKLTNLAGDLALSLGVASVRIAPIPDKISTVGVEVPNKLVSTVFLRDIIESPEFKNAQSKLSFSIGKDIGGNSIVGNIAKLPHLLIAGTTGSGKSVCMNSLIISLMFKATPDEVRLIMIDPKMVELGIYNGIPHLFIPVVTDPKKAAGALQWSVVEMMKRYRLFSEVGVRDLSGYNAYQKRSGGQTMPQVVIVIDELADLMLVASKEVEESICRVAQMGRASGMHLVIATQRPSADVITGLMKANIPSRIAFAVSSAMESRIILDTQGAEKLVGSGDMLYSPLGAGKPIRVQGAFVSDDEREKVINFVKSGNEVTYSEEIMTQIEQAAQDKSSGSSVSVSDDSEPANDYDELLPQAVDVILDTKQASVSMLQRRLKLGYARAARIVDQMEEIGVVGPFEGSKPRQLLITREQWQEMQMIQGTAPIETIAAQQMDLEELEEDQEDEFDQDE